ncbi:hypothetical protein AABB24_014168 [Solanum stoloniferum]|uniref:Uncharacterized protein n=1 Tax=Solanum stoloniferum TaxID=62892 RepID=A0ABD2TYC4_9SOLN
MKTRDEEEFNQREKDITFFRAATGTTSKERERFHLPLKDLDGNLSCETNRLIISATRLLSPPSSTSSAYLYILIVIFFLFPLVFSSLILIPSFFSTLQNE